MLLKNVSKDVMDLRRVRVAPVQPLGEFSLDGNCDRLLSFLKVKG